jgi:DnaJ-related protein SCJ1
MKLRRLAVGVAVFATTALCISSTLLFAAAQDDDTDYYSVLELPAREEASEKDIKQKFRILSKKFHPDLNPSEENRQKYVKVQRAYEVLSDRRKRKIYDMKGEEGLKQLEAQGQNRGHQHDIFGSIFGHGGGGGGVQKGQNAQLNLNVPLPDIYNGNTHRLTLQKQKLCRRCRGSGAASKKDFTQCSACQGKGHVIQRIQLMPGFVQQMQAPCDRCGGTGKMIKKKCPDCKGAKVYRGEHPLEVDIEQGVPEGHQIVFEMEGDQSPDVIPGDVIFVVHSTAHDVFKRKGNDLEATMRITLRDALLGFTRSLPHMDGHPVEVSMEGVVQHGTRVKIAGEGMPKHNVPSEKGDLFVTLEVDLPRHLSEEQKERLGKVLANRVTDE